MENAVQSSNSVVRREPSVSPPPSPTPGPAEPNRAFVEEKTPERSPEGNGTVSSTPEKAAVVASGGESAGEHDLVDSTSTPDSGAEHVNNVKETSNEVSSTEGSIPDYSVDLVTISSSADTLVTPDSKQTMSSTSSMSAASSSSFMFKTPAEPNDVVSSANDTPKTCDGELKEKYCPIKSFFLLPI